MNREAHSKAARKRLAVALGVSAGLHAIALATVNLDIPVFEKPEGDRTLEVVDLPDQWTERAVEVVALETSRSVRPMGAATEAEATSARVKATRPGSAGAETAVAAIIPKAALPSAAAGEPAVDQTLASATPMAAIQIASRPSNRGIIKASTRGIVQRTGGAGAAGEGGFDFVAASDAAREAERERGGNGLGGLGGIGITLLGGGGEHCPPGAVAGIGGLGGLGGFGPTNIGNKGLGVIGRRPPGGSAINRAAPGRGR